MGPGETFVALAGILAGFLMFAWGVGLAKRHIAFKEKELLMRSEGAAGRAANAEIEERLRVLERIVTDRGYDVAHQIEALRDARPVPASIEVSREKEAN
jgi:hypothetical protein